MKIVEKVDANLKHDWTNCTYIATPIEAEFALLVDEDELRDGGEA